MPLITLQQIRDHSPCKEGWEKVYKAYGPNLATTVSLGDVAKSNDAQDALWCIRCGGFTKQEIEKVLQPLVVRAAKYASGNAADCAADNADTAARYAAARYTAGYAADAAAGAARYAAARYPADATNAAYAAATAAAAVEREKQIQDIISVFPLTH